MIANDNFIVVSIDKLSKTGSSSYQPGLTANVVSNIATSYTTVKEYNPTSGQLTAYVTLNGEYSRTGGVVKGSFPTVSTTSEVQVYLVY